MAKQNQPKPTFGFYAVVPRIVRTKYKDLSHAEKWLYVCLKDLCGDKGTCFRTLRALSEETDISTGSLSKMIPHLHEAGLIHAEKKRRTESGKEVWHITIADVWAENAKVCSEFEPSQKVVQNLNDVVQKMNEKPKDCSKNERDCSNFVDRRKNTEERTIIEERTEEERKNDAAQKTSKSTTPDQDDSFILSFLPSSSSSLSEVLFSEEENAVYELAIAKRLSHLKRNEAHKSSCASLARENVTSLEQMESLMQFCHQRSWLAGKDLNLKNLVNELNGWSQLQSQMPTPEPEQTVTESDIASMVSAWSHLYKDTEHITEHQQEVARIHREYGMDNSTFFDLLYKVKEDTDYSGNKSMSSFFRMLEIRLRRKRKVAQVS